MATTPTETDEQRAGKGLQKFGDRVSQAGDELMARSADRASQDSERLLGSMKKGGRIKKTGKYRLHKGERVVPAKRGKKSRRGGKGRY